jgi:hypothetical protein
MDLTLYAVNAGIVEHETAGQLTLWTTPNEPE